MTHLIDTREGLPTEWQALLRDYPRESWPENPNFAASIRKWMGAHQMFRGVGQITRDDTELFLNNSLDADVYVDRLAHFGNLLVRNLQGHHAWEDRWFFPELSAAEARFASGIDMLEGDHLALDALLDGFTRQSNRLIQLHHLDPSQVTHQAATVHGLTEKLGRFLHRHLSDEEDLAVPILLHHRMRG